MNKLEQGDKHKNRQQKKKLKALRTAELGHKRPQRRMDKTIKTAKRNLQKRSTNNSVKNEQRWTWKRETAERKKQNRQNKYLKKQTKVKPKTLTNNITGDII